MSTNTLHQGAERQRFPTDLTSLPHWCVWKRDSRGNKIPLSPGGGVFRSNDPSTFASFDQVASHDLIGFVLSDQNGFTGVDLDDCIDEKGKLREWAVLIVARLSNVAYGEISPSGQGIKFITRASKPAGAKCKRIFDGKQAVECYDHARFWTMTGNVYAGCREIGDGQAAIDWLCDEYLSPPKPKPAQAPMPADTAGAFGRCSAYVAKMEAAIEGQRGSDALFRVACECFRFGLSVDDATALIRNEYNHRCEPPWSDSEIAHKVDNALKEVTAKGQFGIRLVDTREQPSGVDLSGILSPDKEPSPQGAAAEAMPKRRATTSASSILDEYLDELERSEGDVLYSVGDCFGEFELGPGLITLLGAPPGTGKTALAMQMVFNALAVQPDLTAVVANAESSFKMLLRRELCRRTDIHPRKLRFGDLSEYDKRLIADVRDDLRACTDRIAVMAPPFTVAGLRDIAEQNEPGLLLVDYLQKFAPPGDPRAGVNEVVGQLRHMAADGWAVLALSATTRSQAKGGAGHDSQKLSLSSFKESGELEFNADAAYLLREGETKESLREITLDCVKNRNGETGPVDLLFTMNRMLFSGRVQPIESLAEYDNDPFAEVASA
ncbi:DnaB-like helicase C-terminal domain-containing protein [Rosistilla oblonga]|uniref:Replicative DNA helicase n=1 Tax=Rosistilla oblonga TaxID=2527990 RepID=A0A518IR06_9BACT|nr:DnaB-like helicase C-terminal domain-containing protein [Rosistilla oblonga]QDV55483.1 Replicative DNA helicase [Rosistilla oblonga]